MKRLHIHISVSDLQKSSEFYSQLFAQKPSVEKDDYVKWLLNDPRLNFAISNRSTKLGLDHLGIQAENDEELSEIKSAIELSQASLKEELGTSCCYSNSDKYWTLDPDGNAWEAFHSLSEIPTYGLEQSDSGKQACCAPNEQTSNKHTEAACC
ncbi:ArsI/CadI family heavy metal resistance metalloenzyme [Kangiella sp. TOML190]|uniref:ArsI/CadI family heavy metal resistance metalloenzyme n=1 Tax=Kangiella sp. TOML190 TaxID=2931351 RepID=UPI00204097C1|nr:ArsI/CadI family heavy metal resistance metalloenzyme [Kangiella sp. TOML190]